VTRLSSQQSKCENENTLWAKRFAVYVI